MLENEKTINVYIKQSFIDKKKKKRVIIVMLDRKALAPEMNNLSSVEFSRSVPSDSLRPPG